jgi:HTH-type transcriptional regulator/antitoxin HigA
MPSALRLNRKDRYLELVKRFPLRPIRTEREANQAIRLVDGLLERRLSRAEADYLEVLSDLLERYEDETVEFPELPRHLLLAEMMRFHGINQVQLSARTGIPISSLSEILSGKRDISKQNVKTLSRFFAISSDLLL